MPKTIKYLLYFKASVILVASFVPYIGTHMFRQNDTLGVTIRYWLRWFHEPELKFPFFPAILNSGDAYGITPMELPLLNLLTVPGFIFGLDYGRYAAVFLHSLIILSLVYWNYKVWKDKEILGIKVSYTPLLYIIYGIAHEYFIKYIPDPIAFLTMSLACGYSWDKVQVKKSLPLAAIGLLMKPPVLFLFAIYLVKDFKTQLKHFFYWALPAVALCLLYFKGFVPYLEGLSDVRGLFAVGLRSPLTSLEQFFANPYGIYQLILKSSFTKFTLVLILIDIVFRLKAHKTYKLWPLWGIFVIQILASAALIGTPGFFHEYYYISTSFVAALLFKDFLENSHKVLVTIALVILVGHTIERSVYPIRPIVRGHLWYECRELNQLIPADVLKIKTMRMSANPIVGVCMSKIQNVEESGWAVYLHDTEQPDQEEFELVKKTEHVRLYKKRSE